MLALRGSTVIFGTPLLSGSRDVRCVTVTPTLIVALRGRLTPVNLPGETDGSRALAYQESDDKSKVTPTSVGCVVLE